MRPVVEAKRRYDFFDILRLIPRAVVDIGGVTRDLIDSSAGWKTVAIVFGAIMTPLTLVDAAIREAIRPTPDELRAELGEFGYWALMAALLIALAGLIFLLLWGALRLLRDRTPLRSIGLAYTAAQLPIAPITIGSSAVFAAAVAGGVDTSANSTFTFVELTVLLVLCLAYLIPATAAAGATIWRSTAAVLVGPGALVALVVWLSYLTT